MAHFKYLALLILTCFLSGGETAPAVQSSNQSPPTPKAPPGMSWQESSIAIGAFLRPDGWFLKEETKGDTRALFITKENIDISGQYKVGLSVNKIANLPPKQIASPSQFAKYIAGKLASSGEVLKQGVVTGNFSDMNIVRVKLVRNSESLIVHHIIIGDDKNRFVYIIAFEAPESDWEEQIKYSSPMLNYFILKQ